MPIVVMVSHWARIVKELEYKDTGGSRQTDSGWCRRNSRCRCSRKTRLITTFW